MYYDLTNRKNFKPGMLVDVRFNGGEIDRGYIEKVDSIENNKKGILVTLTKGIKGRVVGVPSENEIKKENFRFYNLFFHSKEIYSIYDKKARKYLTLPIFNKTINENENTVLMFTDKEEVDKAYLFFNLDNSQYITNKIDTRKEFLKSFKMLEYSVIRINIKRKLTLELFCSYERKFKTF